LLNIGLTLFLAFCPFFISRIKFLIGISFIINKYIIIFIVSKYHNIVTLINLKENDVNIMNIIEEVSRVIIWIWEKM
jgi:hypothetical protein